MPSEKPSGNSRPPRALLASGLLLTLLACGDLTVDLDPAAKDRLAEFIESDGGTAPEGVDGDPEPSPEPEPEATPEPDPGGVDLSGRDRLDHLALDAVLDGFVQEGLVDYPALAASAEGRLLLDRALALIADVDPAQLADPPERLAFWLNAYNALVLHQALVDVSINPVFSTSDDDFSFFKAQIHAAAGLTLSLDQIEHGIIRGQQDHPSMVDLDAERRAAIGRHHADLWGGAAPDPRIHVGLNCAATSCPLLPSFAFRGDRVAAQLDARAALFVADPARGAGPQGVSSLFDWFAADFSAPPFGSARGFIEAFRQDTADVAFDRLLPYDWTLNCRGCP